MAKFLNCDCCNKVVRISEKYPQAKTARCFRCSQHPWRGRLERYGKMLAVIALMALPLLPAAYIADMDFRTPTERCMDDMDAAYRQECLNNL